MPSVEQLQRLLEKSPEDPFLLYAVAQEHAKNGQFACAVEFYDRSLTAAPDDGYTYFHKAKALGAMGRTEEQIKVLQAGLAAATRSGDPKAAGELQAALEELE
ncbi:MAG: hypothetical protein KF691_11535 [Phycisphaeraceae bacterium]|nr:hypothetical protein [Phycisphaeraceae bacterium]